MITLLNVLYDGERVTEVSHPKVKIRNKDLIRVLPWGNNFLRVVYKKDNKNIGVCCTGIE